MNLIWSINLESYFKLICIKFLYLNIKVVKKYKEKISGFNKDDVNKALKKCEADVLTKIKHENIIKYYGFFIENDQVCIILELCDMDLHHRDLKPLLQVFLFIFYLFFNNVINNYVHS
jgi:serine/threonine protein kinase